MTISEIRALYSSATPKQILAAYMQAEPEATDKYKSDETMLHLACSMADADAVALLLQRGLNPNARNRYGQTPLFALARLDDRYKAFSSRDIRRCADLLLEAKANVIRKDEDLGHTPITMAGEWGRYELLEAAVAHGAKMTGTDRDGNNALHLVCYHVRYVISALGHAHSEEDKDNANRRMEQFYKSAQVLLEAGLDIDEKNDRNQTVLELAIESNADSIALLLKGVPADSADAAVAKTGGMELLDAVIKNKLDAIRATVALGADLNTTADTGEFAGLTPLAIACYTLELPTVQCLLELGVDVNFKDAQGRTAIAKWFVHLGDFHLNMQKAHDKTPVQIIKALLAAGMDKDGTINDKSYTPLLAACGVATTGQGYNNFRMGRALAETLLAAGCDVNCANLDGVTPLMTLCEQHGDGIENLVADVLDSEPDLHAQDKKGNTALHYAAINSRPNTGKALAELLFDYGFTEIEAANNDGKTALELASENGNEPLISLILTQM